MKNILIIIILFILSIFIAFGVNAAIVWVVCKCMGWTFAWKWVILFTIAYSVLHGIFSAKVQN